MPDLDLRELLSAPLAPQDDPDFVAAAAAAVRRERRARTLRRLAIQAAIVVAAGLLLGPALVFAGQVLGRAAGSLGMVVYGTVAGLTALLLREALAGWERR